MSPADHAAAILTWLTNPGPATALQAHADALADAADADDEAVRKEGLSALFAGVVEPLNDGFSPAGRDLYAQVFPRIVWRVASRDGRLQSRLAAMGISDEASLHARYQRARAGNDAAPADAARIAVLSRVTIGADILLTSVAVQRLHQRYPHARIDLVGDAKLGPLLGALPGVQILPVAYGRRGPLRDRLASWIAVADAVRDHDLVVAPDSRLDQLGILPLTSDPARYHLWENTLPDNEPAMSLSARLDAWLCERFAPVWGRVCTPSLGLDAPARVAAECWRAAWQGRAVCAVKLDHGGNPAKALPRATEVALLARLRELGWIILLDRGFGSEELANSDALLAAAGLTAVDLDDSGSGKGLPITELRAETVANAAVVRFHGSIAGWAAAVTSCQHAVSYDSVGHHLAAAAGIPVTVAFTGHNHDAFPIAWQPRGPAAVQLVIITAADRATAERRLLAAIPNPPQP